jgi:DNA-binding CsgD family transcriptional regulator
VRERVDAPRHLIEVGPPLIPHQRGSDRTIARRDTASDAADATTERDPETSAPTSAQTSALLDLICEGLTIGAASERLSISRRTAVRRIAAAREARGLESTAALLVRHRMDSAADPASTDDRGAEPGAVAGQARRSELLAGEPGSGDRGVDRAALVTAREREVLDLVAAGHSNPEIACLLGVSRSTVRRLLDNARAKLGARDRVEAAALLALHRSQAQSVRRRSPSRVTDGLRDPGVEGAGRMG